MIGCTTLHGTTTGEDPESKGIKGYDIITKIQPIQCLFSPSEIFCTSDQTILGEDMAWPASPYPGGAEGRRTLPNRPKGPLFG